MNNDQYNNDSDTSAQLASQQRRAPRRRVGHPLNQRPLPVHEADDDNGIEEDEGYDDVWPPRMPTSARRYTDVPTRKSTAPQVYTQSNRRIYVHHGLPPGRQTATQVPPPARRQRQPRYEDDYETEIPTKSRRRAHWMLSVGVGMLAMIALWVAGSWVLQWWQVHQDDVTYGRPRTFQTDAVVGHTDSPTNPSHFLAINLNRHVLVIECPGGDCAHAVIYLGPTLFGDGQDLTPVTLTFKDLNGDGKPDMIVHLQDQRLAFLNENGKFQPAKPGEVRL